jgi:hypothetical protein
VCFTFAQGGKNKPGTALLPLRAVEAVAEDKKIESILTMSHLESSKALYKAKKAPLFQKADMVSLSAKDQKLMKAVRSSPSSPMIQTVLHRRHISSIHYCPLILAGNGCRRKATRKEVPRTGADQANSRNRAGLKNYQNEEFP